MSEKDDDLHDHNITDEELKVILAAHRKWQETDGKEGKRADLGGMIDLMGGRLAGANLAGAIMPPNLKRLRELTHIDATVEIARPIYIVLLFACIYALVSVISTDDLSLVTNAPIQLIPQTGLGVPVASFFITVPILLFGFYFYLHIYLYRLWQTFGRLPTVFHDGTPLDQAVSPWLATAYVRFYQRQGAREPSLLGLMQKWVTIMVVWWFAPVALVLFWARYLVRHDWAGTALHTLLVAVSVWSALLLHGLAVEAIQGRWQPFRGIRKLLSGAMLLVSIGAVFAVLSLGAIEGERHGFSMGAPATWAPGALNFLGMPPFAHLSRASLDDANLRYADLRGADFTDASMKKTDLSHGDLRGADLSGADLQSADLGSANLRKATLWNARLEHANLSNAELQAAVLDRTSAVNADFRGAKLGEAKLNGANFLNANFSNANLKKADLSETNLQGAVFLHAFLKEADLGLAKLDRANLFRAKLHGADLFGATFKGVDLSNAMGLTQDQIDQACGNNETKLPAGFTIRPCPE